LSNQNQYSPNPYPYERRTSSLAVVSLISGIASFFIVPLLGAIAAIITGNMAKKEIRQSSGRLGGSGMATWGQILGWINLGIGFVGVCLGLLFFLLAIGGFTLPLFLAPFFESGF
jgi:tetrahydromethanopterin S-methyltransferase subunit C